MNGPIKDPALYRRMSEPMESAEAANAAVHAFFEDLRAIREKHHIRDVLCSVQVAHLHDGEETVSGKVLTVGSTMESLHMAAVTYGHLRAENLAALDAVVAKRGRGAS